MRENDACEHVGQGAHRERFREPGHALEKHVTAGEEADQETLDHEILPDDPPADLRGHFADRKRHPSSSVVMPIAL